MGWLSSWEIFWKHLFRDRDCNGRIICSNKFDLWKYMFAFRVQIAQAYFVSCYKNQLIRAVRVNNYRESWTRNKCSALNLRGLKRYIKLPRSCKCDLSGGLWWNLTVGVCIEGFSAEFQFGQYRLGISLASFRFCCLSEKRKSSGYQFVFGTFWIFFFCFCVCKGHFRISMSSLSRLFVRDIS